MGAGGGEIGVQGEGGYLEVCGVAAEEVVVGWGGEGFGWGGASDFADFFDFLFDDGGRF